MKKVFEYLPLHFCVCLIVGIVLQFYTVFWKFGFFKLCLTLSLILILLLLIKSNFFRTLLAFILFFFIGISAIFVNNDRNYVSYYESHLTTESSIVLKVSKVLKSSSYHDKYEVNVVQVDSLKTIGKVLLNISKDSLVKSLKVDELIYTKPAFVKINKPLNPHQFNYQFYLEKQGVHQQIYLNNSQYESLGFKRVSLIGLSAKFRNKIQEALKKYNFKPNELAVINALLLGQRQEISKKLISDYSKAGAIHILAVSGLHVGIILWILTLVLKPLERVKKGKSLKVMLIVLLLWMFAFIAGLSASVVRAVTMFTFLAIGFSFHQKNVILFSLITSIFFLLLIKPIFLFDVGFQLSYLAVLGIVLIQPKLAKLYKPRFKLDKKIWEIFTVSSAAQIGVLPLSLFYFHQFPGLFMLSNLIIIPFLGAILIGGIIIIAGALMGNLPQFLATIYGIMIRGLNNFISWVSNQEQFLFKEIPLSFLMMLVSYLVIVLGASFFIHKSSKKLIYFLISILIIQSVFLYENHKMKSKKEFVIFHKSRNSILGNRVGKELFVNHDLDSFLISKSNSMVSYMVGENVNQSFEKQLLNIYKFDNEMILVIDSLGVFQLDNLKNPVVVLQQSSKINLERLIQKIAPKQIIADGSNYKSYVKRWEKICVKQKTPFHYTGNGAFILKKSE